MLALEQPIRWTGNYDAFFLEFRDYLSGLAADPGRLDRVAFAANAARLRVLLFAHSTPNRARIEAILGRVRSARPARADDLGALRAEVEMARLHAAAAVAFQLFVTRVLALTGLLLLAHLTPLADFVVPGIAARLRSVHLTQFLNSTL
jgi:hypothetical protein